MNVRAKARITLVAVALATLIGAAWLLSDAPGARAETSPSLEVDPPSAAPGESVTLRGSGWPAGTTLTSHMYDPSIPERSSFLGTAFQVDANGCFSTQGTIPNTLFGGGSRGHITVVPGSYTIDVTGGDNLSASVPFTVGAPTGGSLLWGQVVFDTNGNGQLDQNDSRAGEFTGVSIAGPTPAGSISAARTDSHGRYLMMPIEPGSYTVSGHGQYQSSNWTGSVSVEVQAGQVARADLLLRLSNPPSKPERYFKETGFSIDNDAFWDYFTHRGGIRTLGYPVSRTFQFQGYPTQFFQRLVLQEVPGQGVQRLNLLDPGLLPYTHINGSQFPPVVEEVKQATPRVDEPDYDTRVIDFVRRFAPNEFKGQRTGFFDAFVGTVTMQDAFPDGSGDTSLLPLLNLEIWGVPTSNPTPDPNNSNFVYLRFQRGILHYQGNDAQGNPITEGILLGDWFKSLITGRNLPADLEAEARADSSPYLRQYDPNSPGWVARPEQLPNTNLSFAFEPQ